LDDGWQQSATHLERLEASGQQPNVKITWELQEHYSRLAARSDGDVEISEADFQRTLSTLGEKR
jgi:hypothetical protein